MKPNKNRTKIEIIKETLKEKGIKIPGNIESYANYDKKNLLFEWGIDSYRNAIRSNKHNGVSRYDLDDVKKTIKDLGVNVLNIGDYEFAKKRNLEILCEHCDNVYIKSLSELKLGKRCPLCSTKDGNHKKSLNENDIARENGYRLISEKDGLYKCSCYKGHTFERSRKNIIANKNGCPLCQKESEYKQDFGIFTCDDYTGLVNKAHFTCKICGNTQYTYFGNIRGGNMCRYCVRYNKSKGEQEIIDLIKKYGGDIEIITNSRSIIPPQEIDIYIPSLKVAIEYNGFYWHSKLEKNYHKNKSLKCREKGIRLIHIYDFESDRDKNMVISSLFTTKKVFARKCLVREIDQKTYKEFCEINHLMGYRKASILYGLYHNDELVQIASFSKSNFKGYDYEWIRGCPASYNRVVGGTGKLFKHFLNEHKPNNVLCYADLNKFDGSGYSAIGFRLDGFTTPNKWVLYNGKVIKRNPNLYKEYKNSPTLFGAGNMRFVYE